MWKTAPVPEHQIVNLLFDVPPKVSLRGWSDVRSDGVNPLRTSLAETVSISALVPHSPALKLWSPKPVQLWVDTGRGEPEALTLPGQKEVTVTLYAERSATITADCTECYLAYGMTTTLHRPVPISPTEQVGSVILAVLLLALLTLLLFGRNR